MEAFDFELTLNELPQKAIFSGLAPHFYARFGINKKISAGVKTYGEESPELILAVFRPKNEK